MRDSVIGGVASQLGGGKFKNGAVTAAFARLFNDEIQRKLEERRDHKLYLVVEEPNENSTAGHAFIGGIRPSGEREALGFYPEKKNLQAFFVGLGNGRAVDDVDLFDLALDGNVHFRMQEYAVTASQYDSAMNHMRNLASQDYGLFSRNCLDAAVSSLYYAGVIKTQLPVMVPHSLFRAMQPTGR